VYLVATSQGHYKDMPGRLQSRTGLPFGLLTDPSELSASALVETRPRYIFFPHWSYRIPPEVYVDYPCVIFHMTDVPYGRGGSPLQNLILRGHASTKISALRCVEALDAGPVYLKRELSLDGSAREIFARAGKLMEDMIIEIVEREPVPVEQTGEPVLFERRTPRQSDMSQVETVRGAYDFVRMLDADGYPHAFLKTEGLHLEFTEARMEGDSLVARVEISRRDDHDL